ncbi:hypothetical protein M0R72_00505 [Candidatus Pacearchaeota archaeon]|jgi:hypothetical protein|nr:hypothetical protein [Candidatus Pacearchaeota archaeon]
MYQRFNQREWRRNWDRDTQITLSRFSLVTFYIFAPTFLISFIYIIFNWKETDLLNGPPACIAAMSLILSVCGILGRIKHLNNARNM